MALRTILTREDPVLTKKCHPVTRFDPRLWDLLDDMRETLTNVNGAGLAAPQVGILRRAVLVVTEEGFEGCLSVPGLWGQVTRPAWVKVRAQNRQGEFFEVEGADMTARCFCHELAHLDGQLYTQLCDRLLTTEELDELLEEEGEA